MTARVRGVRDNETGFREIIVHSKGSEQRTTANELNVDGDEGRSGSSSQQSRFVCLVHVGKTRTGSRSSGLMLTLTPTLIRHHEMITSNIAPKQNPNTTTCANRRTTRPSTLEFKLTSIPSGMSWGWTLISGYPRRIDGISEVVLWMSDSRGSGSI
ncbi:hypothetical protein BJ165DRAFT_1411254 [Panaeolus papilionaceus]|nr:hypothetical protein BJ165DRAFT_1411254 [Panaeolus papilionaceus]